MALQEDLEFQKLSTLVRQFKWEVVRQEVSGNELVVVLKKTRELPPAQAGGGTTPVGAMPT